MYYYDTPYKKKYKVDGLDRHDLWRNLKSTHITQYYLNLSSVMLRSSLAVYVGEDRLNKATEARIQIRDNMDYYLMLKYKNLFGTDEVYETFINPDESWLLARCCATGMVRKERYDLGFSKMDVILDYYIEHDLCVVEVETCSADPMRNEIERVVNEIVHLINPKAVVTDVSKDPNFKNAILAISAMNKESFENT